MERKLTASQYWAVIILAFGLLIVNGYLVLKVLSDEIPKQCPIPADKISFCECVYNALGDGSLRYCICYGGKKINFDNLTEWIETKNGTS